jgi:hypothetical protein
MKCYLHPDVDAVDKCTLCGREMCAECKLDYDGKIVCKPCAMPLMNLFGPLIYGGCDCGPAAGNVTCKEYVPPEVDRALESTVSKSLGVDAEEVDNSSWKVRKRTSNEIIDELRVRSTADMERIRRTLPCRYPFEKDGRIISSHFQPPRRHRVRFKDLTRGFRSLMIDASHPCHAQEEPRSYPVRRVTGNWIVIGAQDRSYTKVSSPASI